MVFYHQKLAALVVENLEVATEAVMVANNNADHGMWELCVDCAYSVYMCACVLDAYTVRCHYTTQTFVCIRL